MTSVSGDPLLGHVLDGRYEVQTRLARGGMATVYKALDQRLGRIVAVKVMHDGLGDDTDFAKKFDLEARAAARLSHPNVVSVFDQGHDNGRPYIVMEYVEGTTLRSVIVRDAPLTPLRVLELLDPVLSALAAAHEAGLVHRDVKPENVLISTRGSIKVADFGLAKALSAQTATATQGLLIGTVSYVPPELVMSGKADMRSDVYSTGVVLFEMLTGQKPHTGDSPIQVAYAHVHNDVPPPSSLMSTSWRQSRDAIPPYLDALVQSATARDPQGRPDNARILQQRLREARAALLDGVMDDPDMTRRFAAATDDLVDDAAASPVTLPGGGLGAAVHASSAVSPLTPSEPRTDVDDSRAPWGARNYTDLPRTPVSPQDFEHTLPPAVHVLQEQTPVAEPAQLLRSKVEAMARRSQQQRRRRGVLALLLVALLTAVAATSGWWLAAGRYTVAPDMVGESLTQAEIIAGQSGLEFDSENEFSESIPKNVVISSEPAPSERVRRNGTMTAVISKGPERYEVPQLSGLSQSKAEEAIGNANLRLGEIEESYNGSVSSGAVISASLDAGSKAKPGTAVDLDISIGPKPITIKSYTGKSANKAEKALKKAGFRVNTTTKNSDSVDKGDVISQSPNSGTGAAGDTITLVESKGPVLATVPNVKGQGVKDAKAALVKAGFKVSTQQAKENYLGLGFVASASPGFGTKAPVGSTITLYLV